MGYGFTKPISLQFDLKNSRLLPKFKKAQTTYSFLYVHILILEYLKLYIFLKKTWQIHNYSGFPLFMPLIFSFLRHTSISLCFISSFVLFPMFFFSCFTIHVPIFQIFIFLIFLHLWTSLLWTVRASSPLFPYSKIWVGELESFSHPSVHTRYTVDA